MNRIDQAAHDLELPPPPIADRAQALPTDMLRLRSTVVQKSAAGELQATELLPAFPAYVTEVGAFLDSLLLGVQTGNGVQSYPDDEPPSAIPQERIV